MLVSLPTSVREYYELLIIIVRITTLQVADITPAQKEEHFFVCLRIYSLVIFFFITSRQERWPNFLLFRKSN